MSFKHWQKWKGETCVVMASGPSLDQKDPDARFQVEVIEAAHAQKRTRVITVNDTYLLAPFADAHYAGDRRWWSYHIDIMKGKVEHPDTKNKYLCRGEFWTRDNGSAEMYKLNRINTDAILGLSKRPGYVNHGTNSGQQAIGLAYQFGCNRILLVGFDCKYAKDGTAHFFGNHPSGWGNAPGINHWVTYFRSLGKDLQDAGIECVNCSLDTAIDAFKLGKIEDFI